MAFPLQFPLRVVIPPFFPEISLERFRESWTSFNVFSPHLRMTKA